MLWPSAGQVSAFGSATLVNDDSENTIENGTHRRLGFDRQFRRPAMTCDADAETNVREWGVSAGAHGD